MIATPVRLEWIVSPPPPSKTAPATRLMLHVVVNKQPLTLNVGSQLRPLVGMLRPNRRAALAATLPTSLTLKFEHAFRGPTYLVDRQDLQFWAEDALAWLAANPTRETATHD